MRQKVSSHFPFFLKAHCKTVLISCKLHYCKIMETGIILLIDQVAAVFFVKKQRFLIWVHLKPRPFTQFSRLISTNQNVHYNQATLHCDCLKVWKAGGSPVLPKNLQFFMSTIYKIIPVSIALHHCFIHIGVRELLLRTFYGWENAIIDLLEENLHLQQQKQSDLSCNKHRRRYF